MSGHAQHPWYKRYPSNFLAGTRGMRPIVFKAYTRLIDGTYEYGGPLPADAQWLAHLLELRANDVPRLLGELVEAGKIEIVDGLIHNKRTDIELGKMNGVDAHLKPSGEPVEPQSAPSDAPVERKWKSTRGKKRKKNYARASDPPRDHAHPVPEAEAEGNKALPTAESFITNADASGALPPREDAAVASPGLEGRSLAPHPAQVEPEEEFSDQHRATMLKRWADHLASLPSEPIGPPALQRDRNGVPKSRLMEALKPKESGHDDDRGADPTPEPDAGGDHGGQEPVPGIAAAPAANPGATGLLAALEFGRGQGEEE